MPLGTVLLPTSSKPSLSHYGHAKIGGIHSHSFCDTELRRLKEIERLARDRFFRLSQPGTFGGDAEVIKAAEELCTEAAAAVAAYQAKGH